MSAHSCPDWCVSCAMNGDLPAAAADVHRSAMVALALPAVYGDELPVYIELRQQVSVHPTEPVLAVWRAGDTRSLLLPRLTVRGALAAVVQLVGAADRGIALEMAELHAAQRAAAATAVRGQVRDGQ